MPTHRSAKETASRPQRSRGRPPIPLARIVASALDVVDEGGADALTMRSLAQRLNSSTATLYRHFPGRGDLVAHVVDLVFGEVDLDALGLEGQTWSEATTTLSVAMLGALTRRKNVARLLIEHAPAGPNAARQRERSISVLLAGGFPPRLAALAYTTLARYVLGYALQAEDAEQAPSSDARLASAFAQLDPSEFPATQSVARFLPVPLQTEFHFGLEMLLAGLAQQLAAHVPTPNPDPPPGKQPRTTAERSRRLPAR